MAKLKIKPPKELRARLRSVAKQHDFASERAVIDHFIARGLSAYQAPDGLELAARMDHVVDQQGYSSRGELIEHLLMRGLRAYIQCSR